MTTIHLRPSAWGRVDRQCLRGPGEPGLRGHDRNQRRSALEQFCVERDQGGSGTHGDSDTGGVRTTQPRRDRDGRRIGGLIEIEAMQDQPRHRDQRGPACIATLVSAERPARAAVTSTSVRVGWWIGASDAVTAESSRRAVSLVCSSASTAATNTDASMVIMFDGRRGGSPGPSDPRLGSA